MCSQVRSVDPGSDEVQLHFVSGACKLKLHGVGDVDLHPSTLARSTVLQELASRPGSSKLTFSASQVHAWLRVAQDDEQVTVHEAIVAMEVCSLTW
jgi:deferrochelatase/peroxidase EfeB